jgi:BirA family biotin operon repressor/biotin-[acetyl-CoA-carboxylase] ligase
MDKTRLEKIRSSLPWINLRFFEETTSTNDAALEWLYEGCSEYSLVCADVQTRGRGRSNRKWITRAGSALAFSIVLFPQEEEITHLAHFSPLGALAVCQALESLPITNVQIKWPNDVLINRKKVCGILSEAQWQEGKLRGLILGIGVNILQGSITDDDPMQFPATSIVKESGLTIQGEDLLALIVKNLHHWRACLGSRRFYDYWMDHLAFRGEKVSVQVNEKETISGILKGVAQDGNLEIELNSGELTRFMIGDVHLRSGGGEC